MVGGQVHFYPYKKMGVGQVLVMLKRVCGGGGGGHKHSFTCARSFSQSGGWAHNVSTL